jgi:hypothetical protein
MFDFLVEMVDVLVNIQMFQLLEGRIDWWGVNYNSFFLWL